MTRLRADLLLLLAAILWGVAFYFQKEAMTHVGVATFITARATIAALLLAPLAVLEHRRKGQGWPDGLTRIAALTALAFLIAAGLQQTAITTATVTNTGFLTALYVVFTPLTAYLITRHVPPRIVWPGIALAFAGTWLLGGGTIGGLSDGDWLALTSAFFWAVHVVVTGLGARHDRPFAFTCLQFAFVALTAALVAAATEAPTREALSAAAPSILYVGVLANAVTFTILVIALRHTSPPEASVILSTESLFAALAGAYLLGETLSPISWAGAALILAAALLVQLAPLRLKYSRT